MSRGYVFRPSYTDSDGKKQRSRIWWIGYSHNGQRHRESSKTRVKAEAELLLARRLADLRPGGPPPGAGATFADLVDLLRTDHRRKRNRSRLRVKHLTKFFEGYRAADITHRAVDRYMDWREGQDAAPATINRELAALRRMLRLGQRVGMVYDPPSIEALEEHNKRKGFVTDDQFQGLHDALPDYLKPLIETLYVTGWRKSDVVSRQWEHVDFKSGWLKIGRETKEKSPRRFPLIPRLRTLLEAQAAKREELEGKINRQIEHVYFYYTRRGRAQAGDPVGDFRVSWKNACEAAGLPDLRVHDLRRSAVRNFVRSGISEKVAMDLTGHKTRSMFDRYDITSDADLIDAGDKVSAFFDSGEE